MSDEKTITLKDSLMPASKIDTTQEGTERPLAMVDHLRTLGRRMLASDHENAMFFMRECFKAADYLLEDAECATYLINANDVIKCVEEILARGGVHDALVAALKAAERAIDDCQSYRSHLNYASLTQVRDALAKAGAA